MLGRRLLAVLAGVMAFGALPSHAAEIAASIQYDFVQSPANPSAELRPPESVSLRFLAIKAIDGFQVDTVLWQPDRKAAASTTLVVMIHGSGGNYQSPPQSTLGARLSASGYAALAINTRQHDDAINTENFFDVRNDIDAAVRTGRALGYKTIVLQGHSLGNIQVQYYAATTWDRDIKAVMLLGAFGNLPWKTRSILVQNEDSFKRLIDAAMKSLRDGTPDKVLPVKMQYYTGQAVPVTGQHFLTYRWSETSAADGTFWIRRIPSPVLLIRDQSDAVIQPFEPYQLLAAAHGEGSLTPSIDYLSLPNAKPASLKGHYFDGNEQLLADVIVKWLGDRQL